MWYTDPIWSEFGAFRLGFLLSHFLFFFFSFLAFSHMIPVRTYILNFSFPFIYYLEQKRPNKSFFSCLQLELSHPYDQSNILPLSLSLFFFFSLIYNCIPSYSYPYSFSSFPSFFILYLLVCLLCCVLCVWFFFSFPCAFDLDSS